MTSDGYYRSPTLAGETIVFVGEDDLWSVSANGGVARRLTANLGLTSTPAFSPDGQWLAFIGREEGEAEVYVMPATGGPATRLTYLGAYTVVLGWTPAGDKIVFASNAGQPFRELTPLFAVSLTGGPPEPLPYGPARSVSFGPEGGVVIGRRAWEQSHWKRYRGGTAGDIWIDVKGKGKFKPLLKLHGNLVRPIWLGERVYFLSDHEGVGNLYSCTPAGADVTRHTHHEDFYARQSASDGRRIVYRAGADLYLFDPATNHSRRVEIDFHSSRVQCNRKFVRPDAYLTTAVLHPGGHSLALTARGKAFSMSNWEGAVLQYGEPDGVRYRLPEWLFQAKHVLLVSDAGGEEAFEIHPDPSQLPNESAIERLDGLDIGRPLATKMSPREDLVAFSNHRYELMLLDVPGKSVTVLDKSHFGRIKGIDWSPDGKWIAYGFCTSAQTCAIKLYHLDSGQTHYVTPPHTLYDFGPSFDPGGKYLYFISYRDFNPVHDSVYFDLNFPRGSRPYLVTLKKETPDPFIPLPNGHSSPAPNGKPDAAPPTPPESEEGDKTEEKPGTPPPAELPVIDIDLEGIQQRILPFPVGEGKYRQIAGIKGKVLFTSFPIEGSLHHEGEGDDAGKGALEMYDLVERKKEFVVSGVNSFELSRNRAFFIYRSGKNLRVLKAGEKPDNLTTGFIKKSGWINLSRVRVAVSPPDEWRQMFREAWRLQRDHFWSEDMSSVDWQAVYQRYYPLVDRVTTRAEFSDLLLEMQGELGTSHTYELGGDYRSEPRYLQGFLGADFAYDAATGGYRITAMLQGDSWSREQESPLRRLGLNLQVGDIVLAIDGRRLGPNLPPEQFLVNRARAEIQLTVLSPAPDGGPASEPRPVLAHTLANERPVRYRQWVETNRRRVHEATAGRVGYLHIPDMGPRGYSEFHRYYLAESEREGLIIDLRFNGGGNVSQLLLEKLSQRRIGYNQPRYGQATPYPAHSVLGPMVAITNEYAGSDGDIFSHVFKLLKLGPLIGKRTWGGVVGIWPRHSLVDGTTTTQPEFSFWFEDVGWAVENYGTDPDIEVELKPQDYAAGQDSQLDRALKEIGKLLADNPPKIPDFGAKPSRMLPKLPKSGKRKK